MSPNDNIRRRAACDRCHAQKLRCTKSGDSNICDRCIKARATCYFSPFRQKPAPAAQQDSAESALVHVARPNHSPDEAGDGEKSAPNVGNKRRRMAQSLDRPDVEPSPNALFNRSGPISSDIDFGLIPSDISFPQNFDLDNGFDFTFHGAHDKLDSILRLSPDFTQTAFTSYHNDLMDFNIPSTSPFVAQSHTASNSSSESDGYINPGNLSSRILPQSRTGRGSPGSTGSTDSGSASTIDSCIRQLAHLSIDLHEHEATIPPQSIHDSFLGPEELCRKYPFSVDETFRLTQALVDIYPKFLGSFVKSSPSESSRAINMGIGNFGNGSIGFGKSTVNPESHKRLDSKKLSMDHSAVLLILSCHLRLIEIYEQLFEHMDKCAVEDFGTCATRSTNPEIPLPEVRIGNYVPPPEAAIPMQMLLFIHLASQLNAHAGDLAKKISSEIPLDNPKDRSLQNGQLSLRISQMTAETVKYRANRMQEEISQLRRRMLETGFIA